MTKRDQAKKARAQEKLAVQMYLAGKTLKAIKKRTTVDGFIVRGLAFAANLNACFAR